MRHNESEDGKGLSLRDEQKRLTRRLLIEGALTAFERKGYAATTIEDIVAEANASRATFYLHFKSKADVVLVVDPDARPALARAVRRAHVGRAACRARSSTSGSTSWSTTTRPNRASLDAMDQAVAIEPEVAEVRLANHQETIAVMAESIRAVVAAATRRTPASVPRCSSSQMDRFFDLWIIRGLPFDRERALATLTDLWLSVLGCAAPGERDVRARR